MSDNGPVSKEKRLSVRVDDKLKSRLEEAERVTGVDEATIVRQCLSAFCDHVERNGRVVFPLTIGGTPSGPTITPERTSHHLNEPQPNPRKK